MHPTAVAAAACDELILTAVQDVTVVPTLLLLIALAAQTAARVVTALPILMMHLANAAWDITATTEVAARRVPCNAVALFRSPQAVHHLVPILLGWESGSPYHMHSAMVPEAFKHLCFIFVVFALSSYGRVQWLREHSVFTHVYDLYSIKWCLAISCLTSSFPTPSSSRARYIPILCAERFDPREILSCLLAEC